LLRAVTFLHDRDDSSVPVPPCLIALRPPLQAGRLNAMGEVATPEGETFQLDAGSGHALSAQARAALAQQLAGATTSAAQALGSTLLAASGAGYHAGAAGGSSVIPGITPSSGSAMTGVLGPVGSLPATAAVPMSGTASIPGTAGGTALVPPRGVPTTCILLKNVFDASLETAPVRCDFPAGCGCCFSCKGTSCSGALCLCTVSVPTLCVFPSCLCLRDVSANTGAGLPETGVPRSGAMLKLSATVTPPHRGAADP
jgi:hypothetical protein